MMSITTALPSIDEQIKALPSDALYEIVDGQVVEIEHMGMLAGTFANYLAYLINAFAIPRRLGTAFVEVIYRFRPDLPQRRPDVSFVPDAQWPANLRPDVDPPSLHTVPSLAVEVVSPSNTSAEIEDKRLEYFRAGVKVVWVVHPIPRTIHVYNSPSDCHMVAADGTLDGGAAIPGLQLKVADVFACMFPAQANPTNGTL
jgi:Uma2 family endonuclease